jgi:predicted phosphodiesterase
MSIQWLHLSDIHYDYDNYDTLRLRDKLLKFIKDLHKVFDFIVITGDISYKGQEYNHDLETFLGNLAKVAQLRSLSQMYLVPGNHDIKRDSVRKRIINDILSKDNPSEELNNIDSASYKLLLDGLTSYCAFYHSIVDSEYKIVENPHFIIEAGVYNIIHINTCLVSGTDEEEGQLLISSKKLMESLRKLNGSSSLNIAIGHHSIECLNSKEQTRLRNLFSDYNVDLYLSGHIHQPTFNFENNNIHGLNTFVSGAGIVDEYATPGFIIGDFNHEDGRGTITYYKWNKDEEFWHVHAGINRKAPEGILPFKVNKSETNDNIEVSIEIEEDDFKKFIIEFHQNIDVQEIKPTTIPKDIYEKFKNMRCNPTFIRQFGNYSKYFYIVEEIFSGPGYLEFDKKLNIPNVIISEYQKIYIGFNNGQEIVENMVKNIGDYYKDKIQYIPLTRLRTYIKILTFWTINECDIFNENIGD